MQAELYAKLVEDPAEKDGIVSDSFSDI